MKKNKLKAIKPINIKPVKFSFEIRHIRRQDTFLKPQVSVKTTRKVEVFSTNERSN